MSFFNVAKLAATASTSATQKKDFAPAFCKGLNCPNFTIADSCTDSNGNVIEIRDYIEAEWVGSDATGPKDGLYESSSRDLFLTTFAYINGANSEGATIDMSAPVKRTITPGSGDEITIRTEFFFPYEYQAVDGGKTPPTPTNPAVTLASTKAYSLAVRSFGGFTKSFKDDVQPQIDVLVKQLNAAKVDFKTAPTITQGYDAPFTLENRHNEVAFFVPKGTKCSQ